LKKLGRVYSIAKSGVIVVEASVKNPDKLIGSIVYDKDLRRIGIVTDVFGNVEHPYIVVKPDFKDFLDEIERGVIVYYTVQRGETSIRRGKRERGKK